MARRILMFVLSLLAVSGLLAVGAPAATDYSFIKTGTYSGTATMQPAPELGYSGTSFPVSFRVSAATRKGRRSVRTLNLGPLNALCRNNFSQPAQRKEMTFPRQAGFPPISSNGFVNRSWVRRGGHWRREPPNQIYPGTLPHVDLQLAYQRSPARFEPNPLGSPSVHFEVHLDDAGRATPTGQWLCSVKSVVTLRRAP
jgi:hypothetical protein